MSRATLKAFGAGNFYLIIVFFFSFLSLKVRGRHTQGMSENIRASHKDTYKSKTCSKREELMVVTQ